MNNKTFKAIPLLTLLTAGLMLSSPMAMADKGERDHSKEYSSHNRHQSNDFEHRRGNKHSYSSHKGSHRNGHRYDKHGRHHSQRYYRPNKHHGHQYSHYDEYRRYPRTTYIVNDYYSDYGPGYALDNLRFMIGLQTNHFSVTFTD